VWTSSAGAYEWVASGYQSYTVASRYFPDRYRTPLTSIITEAVSFAYGYSILMCRVPATFEATEEFNVFIREVDLPDG